MKAYVLAGPRRLALVDEPMPEVGPRDVLLKTRVSAVSSGTEVWRYINHGHYGGEGGRCGYNLVGEVVQVGHEVTRLAIGALAFSVQPHAEYVAAREDQVVVLPGGIDLEAAAFTYLPTLGLHALRSAEYHVGDNVLVVGLGIVGLLAAQIARLAGARVAGLEEDATRRVLAARVGFGPVLAPGDPSCEARLDACFGPPGPDVILEASQAWTGLQTGLRLARQGTRIAIIGIYRTDPPGEVARDLLRASLMNRDAFHERHLKLIGCSNDPRDDYPPGVVRWTMQRNMEYTAEQIATGALDTRQAITHRVAWAELDSVYQRLAAGDRSMVGVVLRWD